MRAVPVVLTLAVAGFLVWVARQAHVSSLRAIADEPWDAPEQLWHCYGTSEFRADRPEGPALDLEVIRANIDDGMCGNEVEPLKWVRVAPRRSVEAWRQLGDPSDEDHYPVFDLSRETRIVGNRKWLRWDLRRAAR